MTTARRVSNLPVVVMLLLAVFGVLTPASTADAAPFTVLANGPRTNQKEMLDRVKAVREKSEEDKKGKTESERREINRQERDEIRAIKDEYGEDAEDSDQGIPGRGGQVEINGISDAAEFELGDLVTLTFYWAHLPTGLRTDGPAIGHVVYDVNLDPNEDPLSYTPVGIGHDPLSDFAVPFTIVDFEPFIRATPYDLAGLPIVLEGIDGYNVAVAYVTNVGPVPPVPEPGSLLLLGAGLLTCAGAVARKRKTAPRTRPGDR